jgi:hypothetical protein
VFDGSGLRRRLPHQRTAWAVGDGARGVRNRRVVRRRVTGPGPSPPPPLAARLGRNPNGRLPAVLLRQPGAVVRRQPAWVGFVGDERYDAVLSPSASPRARWWRSPRRRTRSAPRRYAGDRPSDFTLGTTSVAVFHVPGVDEAFNFLALGSRPKDLNSRTADNPPTHLPWRRSPSSASRRPAAAGAPWSSPAPTSTRVGAVVPCPRARWACSPSPPPPGWTDAQLNVNLPDRPGSSCSWPRSSPDLDRRGEPVVFDHARFYSKAPQELRTPRWRRPERHHGPWLHERPRQRQSRLPKPELWFVDRLVLVFSPIISFRYPVNL